MVLLDTCTLLWLAADQRKLSVPAKESLEQNAGRLLVSSISAFEIALKAKKGKLDLPIAAATWFERAIRHHGIREIPVDSTIALGSVALPPLHNDPCDRFIVATAAVRAVPIITCDPLIAQYPDVRVVW
jgi:PIN domain nuclease of toxin-antitoxin system